MRVLHVATSDSLGGAGRVAADLTVFERAVGIDAILAVAMKHGTDSHVFTIDEPRRRGPWFRSWRALRGELPRMLNPLPLGSHVLPFARRAAGAIADVRGAVAYLSGKDDFAFPGSRLLPDVFHPDLIHCHNLHGNYFDLAALPELSSRQPIVLTMHDCWLLSGHCAQSLECERWKTGCGKCPDLTLAPAVARDETAFNWRRKADIYRRSRLHLALPSRWLESRVRDSMLAPAVVETRVIPHGVDLDVFRLRDRMQARQTLRLPLEGFVLLTVANGGRANSYKDIETLDRALDGLHVNQPVTAVRLGESAPPYRRGTVPVIHVGFEENRERMATFYAACDIYVHPTRAEVLPMSVIEAAACGIPVVASDVAGVPEIVRPMLSKTIATSRDDATGWIVPPSNADQLREAITTLLADPVLRARLGENAARDARARFDARLQARRYVEWYGEILSSARRNQRTARRTGGS